MLVGTDPFLSLRTPMQLDAKCWLQTRSWLLGVKSSAKFKFLRQIFIISSSFSGNRWRLMISSALQFLTHFAISLNNPNFLADKVDEVVDVFDVVVKL